MFVYMHFILYLHIYTCIYIFIYAYSDMHIYKILIMFVESSEMDLKAVQNNCSHPQAQNHHLSFITPKSTPRVHVLKRTAWKII